MKKLSVLLLLVALVMAGCGAKSDQGVSVTTKASESETKVSQMTTESTTAETSSETTAEATTEAATSQSGHPLTALGFEQKEGCLEFLELEQSPIAGGGLRIQFFPEESKLHMIKTDASGNDTVEYVSFYLDKKEAEKYRFVSMMGTGFYYYYNIEKQELYKIENDAHEDRTQSSKEAGRFDGASDDMKSEVELLSTYFSGRFMPMEELIP